MVKLNGTSVLKNLKLYKFETISDVQEYILMLKSIEHLDKKLLDDKPCKLDNV